MSKQKSAQESAIHSLIRDIHSDDVIYCDFIEEESHLAGCAAALNKKLTAIKDSYVETWSGVSGDYSGFDDEEDDIPFDNETLS